LQKIRNGKGKGKPAKKGRRTRLGMAVIISFTGGPVRKRTFCSKGPGSHGERKATSSLLRRSGGRGAEMRKIKKA